MLSSKRSGILFAITLTCLIVFLPSLVFDWQHIDSLSYYADPLFYFTAKILIWFILPCGVLILISPLRTRLPSLYWATICYLTAGLYFYLSSNIITSLLLACLLTFAWAAAESVFARSYAMVLTCSTVLLVTFGVYHFWPAAKQAPAAKAIQSASTSAKLNLPQNTYVIIFDEVTKRAIFKDGKVSGRFPNFKRLAAESIWPEQSTTNYDVTERVLPTFLAGKLFDVTRSMPDKLKESNIFDYISPEKLFLWSAMIPYCSSLESKGINAYCLDPGSQSKSLAFFRSLRLDLRRFIGVYGIDVGAASLMVALTGNFDTSKPAPVWFASPRADAVADYLFSMLMQKHADVWLNFIDFDFDIIENFRAEIGKHNQALYFYHSSVAHAPYVANRNLELNKEVRFHAFPTARKESDLQPIYERYLKHVEGADTILGLLLADIDRKDPNSVVIVTSDHGAQREFTITKGLRNSGLMLSDIVEILFFIRLPPTHALSSRAVHAYQHIDFLPTFFDIAGEPSPKDVDGKSIFSNQASDFYFASGKNVYREYNGK